MVSYNIASASYSLETTATLWTVVMPYQERINISILISGGNTDYRYIHNTCVHDSSRLSLISLVPRLSLSFSHFFVHVNFICEKIEGEGEPGMEPRPPMATWPWSWRP